MKLYGTWLSPYAARVLIAARFKGIDLAAVAPGRRASPRCGGDPDRQDPGARRGFCPSCCGRRMAELAAHLVDDVLGGLPVRQWVLTHDEVQHYLRHLIEERRLAWSSCHQRACALRFFYEVTLGRERKSFHIPLPKTPQKLPEILSPHEVSQLLAGVENLKHRVMLMTTYAGGLRVSEVTRLRVSDIDSKRMLIRVEQGKGSKDRYTLLSQRLLAELRRYYRVYRPTG